MKSGKLAGFANDVWYKDNAENTEILRDAPNTVLSPHIGASSTENLLRIGEIIVDIIKNFK